MLVLKQKERLSFLSETSVFIIKDIYQKSFHLKRVDIFQIIKYRNKTLH